MTMHLCPPALTMTGKRKGKQKFRTADQARKKRELDAEWDQKQREWASMSKLSHTQTKFTPLKTKMPQIPADRNTRSIESLDTKHTGAVTIKQTQHYTGDNMLGITIVHKSCLQPVFNQEEAVAAAQMRR